MFPTYAVSLAREPLGALDAWMWAREPKDEKGEREGSRKRVRWEIEAFFHVLKNGCKVEALQLSTMERLELALALYMVVSWRIAQFMRLGRTCPDLNAELLFDRDEWQGAFILNKRNPPQMPPSLNEVVGLIAMLDGFLARKGDGEPGVKTIWLGLHA